MYETHIRFLPSKPLLKLLTPHPLMMLPRRIRRHILRVPSRRRHRRRVILGRPSRAISIFDVLDAGGAEDVGEGVEAGVLLEGGEDCCFMLR